MAQNDVMFAHYAVRRNITYAVNIIADGNITCPKGQTSFGRPALSQVAVWCVLLFDKIGRENKVERKTEDIKSLRSRIFIGIALPLILIAGAVFLYIFKQGPGCMFFRFTGLYCPGCGLGRAAVALLHLDFALALRNNPLVVPVLPVIGYYCLKQYVAYVFGKDLLPFFEIKTSMAIVILVVVVAFWILRNIPIEPFTYLAPI